MLPLRPTLMIADRYRLEARLGAGGMSEVWRAHDLMLGRLVAVKVLSASLLASASSRDLLRREARAMAQLGHPNVASIFDYGEVTLEGTTLPYLVLELLQGYTLANALAQGQLPWPEAVGVAAQVAAALAAAHEQGLVHCDVTPANVMLTDRGVKVLDFGIAATLGNPDSPGEPRFGTPGFVAPERLTPGMPVTAAADMFALGALVYAIIIGHPPGRHDVEQRLRAVPGLPPAVADICLRCLADEPADRPDIADAARLLAAASGVHIGPADAASALPPSRTLPLPTASLDVAWAGTRLRWRLLATVAVVMTAAAVLLLTLRDSAQHTAQPPAAPTPSATPAGAPARSRPPVTTPAQPARANVDPVANLRDLVVAGQAVGEIRTQCAESLLSRITDLQRRIDRGDRDNALQRIEQIGDEIDDRAADGDLSMQRAATLHTALAAIRI